MTRKKKEFRKKKSRNSEKESTIGQRARKALGRKWIPADLEVPLGVGRKE